MVEVMPMKDMSLDADEAREISFPTPADAPRYPYGLSISLCEKELEKLDIDFDDICVGDMVHMHCMAVITSKSCNETQGDGQKCRIELQITHISAESESEEDEAAEEKMTPAKKMSKLYK